MKRAVLVGLVTLLAVFLAWGPAPAGATTPTQLVLPQGAAFAVLGHSCGGIAEQVYATGFDATSGYPTGDAYLKTTCSTGGRGSRPATFTAWASATWDFTGALVNYAKLVITPTVDPTLVAYDSSGNEVYNASAHAYLVLAPGFVPAPRVTALSVGSGPASGGTSLTITGTGFSAATEVDFGAVASSFTIASDTAITATTPATDAGTVDVTIRSAGGPSATTTADRFTFVGQPGITAIAPSSGPVSGGTQVTITGTNLAAVTAVSFGDQPAGFVVDSDTQLTATAPASEAPDAVAVTVTSLGGTATTGANGYTYEATPQLTVSPASGPPATLITITGSGFAGAEHVTVTYATGLKLPALVTLCTPTATAGGAISCGARVPSSLRSGKAGPHLITATGATSGSAASTTFALT